MRRLRELRGHLCTTAPTAWMSELPIVRQTDSGEVTQDSVAELRGLMLAAAAHEDYRTAAQYKTMLDVLAPRAQRQLSEFASEDPDKAADLFLQNGFVVLPNCVSPHDLASMREEYQRIGPECRAQFEERWAAGKERVDLGRNYGFPMTDPTQPPVFIPLFDPPLLIATLHRVLGTVPRVGGGGGRVVPVRNGTPHESAGYISWHRDFGTGMNNESWPYPSNRQIKVSIFLYDVPFDGGALTIVPGSHRLPNAPQQTLERSFCGGRGHYHKPQSPTRPQTIPQGYNNDGSPAWIGQQGRDLPSVGMPNCVQCAVRAGSAVAFDISCWVRAVALLLAAICKAID